MQPKKYYRFVERNQWEKERWDYFVPLTNKEFKMVEKALSKLFNHSFKNTLTNTVCYNNIKDNYFIEKDKTFIKKNLLKYTDMAVPYFTETEVDDLIMFGSGSSTYKSPYNKCKGLDINHIINKCEENEPPYYKGEGLQELRQTIVVAGFPGIGKSYSFNNNKHNILDSDSSTFSWIEEGVRNPNFPKNYIKHVKENVGKVNYIFVSTHKEVIRELLKNKINFILIYPYRSLKAEYLQRFKDRGSPKGFLKLLENKWDEFIDDIESVDCPKHVLNTNEYLSDIVIKNIDYKINDWVKEKHKITRYKGLQLDCGTDCVEVVKTIHYKKFGYIYRVEKILSRFEDLAKDHTIELKRCYCDKTGRYIGNNTTANFLCRKKGLQNFEKLSENSCICSIGFNPKEQKWYGWSHRAICGFGVGSKVKKGDCAFQPSNKEEMVADMLNFWISDSTVEHSVEMDYTEPYPYYIEPDSPLKEYEETDKFLDALNPKYPVDPKHTFIPQKGIMLFTTVKRVDGATFESDHFRPYPDEWGKGEWEAKTLEDAKQMAKDFAEDVS